MCLGFLALLAAGTLKGEGAAELGETLTTAAWSGASGVEAACPARAPSLPGPHITSGHGEHRERKGPAECQRGLQMLFGEGSL